MIFWEDGHVRFAPAQGGEAEEGYEDSLSSAHSPFCVNDDFACFVRFSGAKFAN